MQDIIKYNIIPLEPLSWLGIDKSWRECALDNLHNITHLIPYSGQFWVIVRLLHNNNRSEQIAHFTAHYYQSGVTSPLMIWIEKVLRISIINEAFYDINEVMLYWQYLPYLDNATMGVMIEETTTWVALADAVSIWRSLPREKITNDINIRDDVNDMFFDQWYFGEEWSQDDTKCVKFAIDYFPDLVRLYAIRSCFGMPPNGKQKCIRVIIDYADNDNICDIPDDTMSILRGLYKRD